MRTDNKIFTASAVVAVLLLLVGLALGAVASPVAGTFTVAASLTVALVTAIFRLNKII